jgi:hypothetical protein
MLFPMSQQNCTLEVIFSKVVPNVPDRVLLSENRFNRILENAYLPGTTTINPKQTNENNKYIYLSRMAADGIGYS